MKILIIINSLTLGGAERQVITDSGLLANAGYQVTIAYHKAGELNKQVINKVRLFKINYKNEIKATMILYKYLKKNKFDLIMAHMFWAQKVAVLPSYFTCQKLILFEHGLGLWRKWYHLFIIRFITRFTDKVITVSDAKRKIKIEREKIPEAKIRIIPNCFNLKEIDVIQPNQLSFDTTKFIIGFSGRFNKVKQLSLLIKVAHMLLEHTDQFLFVLLGDGYEKQKIEQLILENNLEGHFYLAGYVTNPQVFLPHFNTFILPSIREDLSVALLEAGAASIPSIAFDVGGNCEIIKDGKTGFIVPPFNIDMMAEKILYLMKHTAIRDKMGNKAQKFVAANFSESKRLERLSSLINEAI